MEVFQHGWQRVSFGCICVVLVLTLVHLENVHKLGLDKGG